MFQVQGPPPPTHGHGTLVLVASSNPPSPCGLVLWCYFPPLPPVVWCGGKLLVGFPASPD